MLFTCFRGRIPGLVGHNRASHKMIYNSKPVAEPRRYHLFSRSFSKLSQSNLQRSLVHSSHTNCNNRHPQASQRVARFRAMAKTRASLLASIKSPSRIIFILLSSGLQSLAMPAFLKPQDASNVIVASSLSPLQSTTKTMERSSQSMKEIAPARECS